MRGKRNEAAISATNPRSLRANPNWTLALQCHRPTAAAANQPSKLEEIVMNNLERFADPLLRHFLRPPVSNNSTSDWKVFIADKRVARLLLILHDIDEAVAGIEDIPQNELVELVSAAIRACGFVNDCEARYAIASVLEAIDGCGPEFAPSWSPLNLAHEG
jgi:hypothetical protein